MKSDLKSQISSFKVSIKVPERWKIQSIAKYKSNKFLKLKQNNLKVQSKNSTDHLINGNTILSTGQSSSPSMITTSAVANDKVIKNNIAVEHIKKELEILNNNSIVIKNKMIALSSVRTSLLWLLKKSNALERSLIS